MTKKSTMLKVISILMIIFGAIALIISIGAVAALGFINDLASSVGVEGVSMASVALPLIASILELVAGIVGLASKSRPVLMGFGVIVLLIALISLIVNTVSSGFNAMDLVSFVLPILYVIGVVQCKAS